MYTRLFTGKTPNQKVMQCKELAITAGILDGCFVVWESVFFPKWRKHKCNGACVGNKINRI